MSCYAYRLAPCDLGDPGWGDPWFPHGAFVASPGCVLPIMDTYPVLVHRQRGTKVFFHQALQERKLFVIPGIHYFDAHRLRAHLLQAQELQLHPRASNLAGPDGAGDTVEDPSSDEERETTDAETEAETAAEEAWCPPMPDAPDDSTESGSLVLPTSSKQCCVGLIHR